MPACWRRWPATEIRAINKPNPAIHTHRTYRWHEWDFDLPPGVFHPGETSRLLHTRLLTEVVGRRETRHLQASVRTLPATAQTFIAVLRDQRRREALLAY